MGGSTGARVNNWLLSTHWHTCKTHVWYRRALTFASLFCCGFRGCSGNWSIWDLCREFSAWSLGATCWLIANTQNRNSLCNTHSVVSNSLLLVIFCVMQVWSHQVWVTSLYFFKSHLDSILCLKNETAVKHLLPAFLDFLWGDLQ